MITELSTIRAHAICIHANSRNSPISMVTHVATTNNVETSNANVECAATIMVNAPSGLMQAPDTIFWVHAGSQYHSCKWMHGNSGPRLCGRLSELRGFFSESCRESS